METNLTASDTEWVAGLDATGQAALVRRGELTASDLVACAISRIERLNPTLNAVVTAAFEQALAVTPQDGPFTGVPYLLPWLSRLCRSG